jgi:cell division control protein 7
MPQLVDLFIH